MEKINYPCPCGGTLKWKKEKIIEEGIDCGTLDVEYCERCGEVYLPGESLEIVENKLKEHSLWGMQRKEIKFWKSGNAIIIRIPSTMSKDLQKVKMGHLYREGKRKLAIEF